MDRNRRDTKTGSDGGRITDLIGTYRVPTYIYCAVGCFGPTCIPLMVGDAMLMLTANGFVGRCPSPSGKADLQTPKSPEGAMFASVGLSTKQGQVR